MAQKSSAATGCGRAFLYSIDFKDSAMSILAIFLRMTRSVITVNSTTMTTVKKEADGCDDSFERDHIDADLHEHKCVQQNAERQADDDAHHGQNDIFTEHIRAGFPGMEAEHLDGGNFLTRSVRLMLPRLNRTMNASAPAEMSTSATT